MITNTGIANMKYYPTYLYPWLLGIAVCSVIIDQIYGAYPLETNIIEMTRVHFTNSWTPFMERRVQRCLPSIQPPTNGFNLILLLRCISEEESHAPKCLNWFHAGCSKSGEVQARCHGDCGITHRLPNWIIVNFHTARHNLPFEADKRFEYNFTISIHMMFSLNITFTRFVMVENDGLVDFGGRCLQFKTKLRVSFAHTGHDFCGILYPWTMIAPSSNATIILSSTKDVRDPLHHIDIRIIYTTSIQEVTYDLIQGATWMENYYWHGIYIRTWHVSVQMLQKIMISVSSSDISTRIKVFDGPTIEMPLIRSQKQYFASSFQAYILIVSQNSSDHVLVYSAMPIEASVLGPGQLIVDNDTRCNDSMLQSLMCVYMFQTDYDAHITLRLMQLRIQGPYKNIHSMAALALYNVVNNETSLTAHWFDSIELKTDLTQISSTHYTMYLVVYAYAPFTYISLNISTGSTKCQGIFIGQNKRPSLSYQPHYMGTSRHGFEGALFIQIDLMDKCITISMIYLPSEFYVVAERLYKQHNIYVYVYPVYDEAIHIKYDSLNPYLVHGKTYGFEGNFHAIGNHYITNPAVIIGPVEYIEMSTSSISVKTVSFTPTQCVHPCHELLNIGNSFIDRSFQCDICAYHWIHGSSSQTLHTTQPTNVEIRILFGNNSIKIHLTTDHSDCCTKSGILFETTRIQVELPLITNMTLFVNTKPGELAGIKSTDVATQPSPCHPMRCPFHQVDYINSVFGRWPHIYSVHKRNQKITSPNIFTSWNDASKHCASWGSTLVTPYDEGDMEFLLLNILLKYSLEYIFINFNKKVSFKITVCLELKEPIMLENAEWAFIGTYYFDYIEILLYIASLRS